MASCLVVVLVGLDACFVLVVYAFACGYGLRYLIGVGLCWIVV